MSGKLHRDEIPVDTALVRKLIDNEFPKFADLPIKQLGASGSSNHQFALGDEYRQNKTHAAVAVNARLAIEDTALATVASEVPLKLAEK